MTPLQKRNNKRWSKTKRGGIKLRGKRGGALKENYKSILSFPELTSGSSLTVPLKMISSSNMRAVVLLCLLWVFANGQFDWNGPGRVAPDSSNNACNVDQSSCGCCFMLQEMNRLKTYFDTTLTDIEEDFRKTNQSLSTLKAKRVAFTAALYSGDNFKCYGPFTTNSIIIYKYTFLNLGGAYSTDTGLLTVPLSGVYSLAVTSYSDSGSPGFTLAICSSLQVNGKTVAAAKDFNTNDKEDSATTAVALQLTAGDKVSVSLSKGCFLCDDTSHYNTFSAFLLYSTE